MAKFWRKWMKIGAGAAVTVTTFTGLFLYLVVTYGFIITDLTGNFSCEGTYENPCVSEFKVRNPTRYNVDIYNQNEIQLDFSPELKDFSLFVKDGRCKTGCGAPNGLQFPGWRHTDFTNETKPRKDKVYVFRFPSYRTKYFLLAGIKNDPTDTIKWGFGTNGSYLDPVWEGIGSNETNWSGKYYSTFNIGNPPKVVVEAQEFDKWRLLSQTGNETLLDVNLNQRTGAVEFTYSFVTNLTKEECIRDRDGKAVCKDVTYYRMPTLRKTSDKQDFLIRSGNSFTDTLNARDGLYYKYGEESIIIVGDTSYASNDTNITQSKERVPLFANAPLSTVLELPIVRVSETSESTQSKFRVPVSVKFPLLIVLLKLA